MDCSQNQGKYSTLLRRNCFNTGGNKHSTRTCHHLKALRVGRTQPSLLRYWWVAAEHRSVALEVNCPASVRQGSPCFSQYPDGDPALKVKSPVFGKGKSWTAPSSHDQMDSTHLFTSHLMGVQRPSAISFYSQVPRTAGNYTWNRTQANIHLERPQDC